MAIVLDGTTGITTPNVASDTSTLGPLTQALNLGSTGQIVFPATQNASSNANTLDDYEEGTWSCTMAPGSGFTPTNNVVSGLYTKIGRQVTVTAVAQMTVPSSLGTYSNNNTNNAVLISGLPFAVTNAGGIQGRSAPVVGVYNNMATNSGVLNGHGTEGTTGISFFQSKDDGSIRTSPTLSVSTTVSLHFCFTYFVI
jgi:hypothetical protein